MQLTFRDVGRTAEEQLEWDRHTIRANEEIMIYGFVIRMVAELNLLDFFGRFQQYVKDNNLVVLDSFIFTRWMMEHERLGVQDKGVVVDINALRKFDSFQDEWLAEQLREHFKGKPDVLASLRLTQHDKDLHSQ